MLKLMLPKGRIHKRVVELLAETGLEIATDRRSYRPLVNNPDMEIKIMKPQNIPSLVELGSHDVGFTGHDWVVETKSNVTEIMDLGFDPVSVVVAIPNGTSLEELQQRKIVAASEYELISRRFLDGAGFAYVFLRTYGATEVFPPDDADLIIDNTATGQTLKENNLKIAEVLLTSSTRFIANSEALKNPAKNEKIQELKLLFAAILNARERVMLEMNIAGDKLETVIKILPCMRSPTISSLYNSNGYAIKTAVKKEETAWLIPLLKKHGATDILEYEFQKVVI